MVEVAIHKKFIHRSVQNIITTSAKEVLPEPRTVTEVLAVTVRSAREQQHQQLMAGGQVQLLRAVAPVVPVVRLPAAISIFLVVPEVQGAMVVMLLDHLVAQVVAPLAVALAVVLGMEMLTALLV